MTIAIEIGRGDRIADAGAGTAFAVWKVPSPFPNRITRPAFSQESRSVLPSPLASATAANVPET
jgi:hypothetical protein